VYCKVPEGWPEEVAQDDVLPLDKTLYGTKQASRQWQKQLRAALEQLGFVLTEADPCVFMKRRGESWIIIVTYVDDIFGTTNDPSMIAEFEEEFGKIYEYTSLGEIHKLLGNWVIRTKCGGFIVTAEPAVKELCKTWGVDFDSHNNTFPDTPAASSLKLRPAVPGEKLLSSERIADYQCLIGSLLFLSVSCRSDITYIVHELGRFVQQPTEVHWNAAMKVLKYLAGTINYGLFYAGGGYSARDSVFVKLQLNVYTDASWADTFDRKSTSGMLITITTPDGNYLGHPISYYSRRQSCVALSSTESEYIAMSSATQTVTWLRRLLSQLGFLREGPTVVHEDNQASIHIAYAEGLSQRTKHIDVRHHYIRQKVADNTVYIVHLSTDEMLADFFTKPLEGSKFLPLRDQFMAEAPR